MEVNKEQAERCIVVGSIYLKTGELDKAEKFFKKSVSMYPTREAKLLLKRVEAARAKAGSNGATDASAPKLNVDYTQEQADVVKRVKQCKDFYEMLGVSQDATDSEIKKSYKKCALQLHPDKNKAPGALEAFKLLGNTVQTLTDPAKRKAYDLYRVLPEARTKSAGRGYRNGQNGTFYYSNTVPEFNPNDLFNMFFGGARGSREEANPSSATGSLFFMVITIVVAVSLIYGFVPSDSLYSLQPTEKHSIERRTQNLKIPYYVKNNFLNEYQGSLGRLEYSVEEEYVSYMRRSCNNERAYRNSAIGRAKSFGSRAQFQQAQQLKMPACDTLHRLGIGKVYY